MGRPMDRLRGYPVARRMGSPTEYPMARRIGHSMVPFHETSRGITKILHKTVRGKNNPIDQGDDIIIWLIPSDSP